MVDAGSESAASSGGGPHQTEKFVSSLSDIEATDWSLNGIGDISCCDDKVRDRSGQSCEDSGRSCSLRLLWVSSTVVADMKVPDKLRGTDVTDRDGPFDSLLGLGTFVKGCDSRLDRSPHRLDNCVADRVGKDIGFGGSLKNVLRLSLTDAAVRLEAPASFASCSALVKSKDVVPLVDAILASGGTVVTTDDDAVTGGNGTVVVRE